MKVIMDVRLALVGVLLAGSPAMADALLDQVVAGAQADRAVQWSVERVNSDFDAAGGLKASSIAHFNGAAPLGARWSLVAVNGKPPSAGATRDFVRMFNSADYAPTYAQVADLLTGPATKISPNCYRVTGLPAKTVMAAGHDLSPYLQARVTVDTSGAQPFVSLVEISAPAPFRPMKLSRVERLERVLAFARGPQGMPVLSQSTVTADFSVLMKTVALRSKTEFHGQRPIVQTAQNLSIQTMTGK